MINFIYETELGVAIGVADDEKNILVGNHYIIEHKDIPTEHQSSWYIEDGQIKIDQQKLIELNRKNMTNLTPIEFDTKLVDAGLYDQVQELIASDIKLKIAYTRATFFSRTDPFIDQARIALGLTDEQVDMIWESSLV